MAKLLLSNDSKLVFLGSRQFNNPKNGNILTFVKLGDPHAFQNYEFMVDASKVNLNLTLNSNVKPDFELGEYNGRPSLNLVGIEAVQTVASK